jgi:SAM-dependent methyltransferase
MGRRSTPVVAPSNADALRAWNGPEADYWVANESMFDASLAGYDAALFAGAGIAAGDRVLDIGCGTGATARRAARLAGSGSVLGVDLSASMLERARHHARREGLDNVQFVHADAQVFPFDGAFDVAISRMGVMFFGDPEAAFTNIARALRRGGRLSMVVWAPVAQNGWVLELRTALGDGRASHVPAPAGAGPFALADAQRVRTILSGAGFADVRCELHTEPFVAGDRAEDAFRFVRGLGFTQGMLDALDDGGRARALDALRASIASHTTSEGVRYPSAAWLVTAHTA